MASRGSVAKNGHVTTNEYIYVYDENGKQITVYEAKVLKGQKNNHGLPDYAHTPGSIYIKLDGENNFRELRVYDDKKYPVLEIAYHPERTLTGKANVPVLHYHTFDKNLSRKMGGILSENKNTSIYRKYKKYLEVFGL